MQIVFIILIIEIFNTIMFYMGVKTSQAVQRNEEIKSFNPIKTIQNQVDEYKEKKEERQRKKEREIMLENINNYDGTGAGQKDID